MISCIIGLPGSGKSTLLSFIAHRAIQGKSINFRGFHIQTTNYARVFTNFPANGGYKLDFDKLGIADYNNCLLLCDEIQLFADSRNFKNFSDNLKFWFSNHRKFHTDFCYCTQDFEHVDKRIRSLTDRIYVVDMLPFRVIRVRQVIINLSMETLGQRFDYGGIMTNHYFYAPRLYKYNDTFALMKEVDLEPLNLVPWVPTAPDQIGEQTIDDKIISYKDNGEIEVVTKNIV